MFVFKHSKMQYKYIFCYLLHMCIGFSPLRNLVKSLHCVVLLKSLRMHSATSHYSHFEWMGLLFPRAKQMQLTNDVD
jgi:hypothetical protein